MKLVNETGQVVTYTITSPGSADCGTIAVDGLADLPAYDNQTNVVVSFLPVADAYFRIDVGATSAGQQVEMAVLAE